MNRTRTASGVVAVVVSGVALVVVLTTHPSPPATRTPVVRGSATATALSVLHDWDERRADAYATASAVGLRDLYVPGSAAGAADLRLMQSYRSRGLRVADLRMQVLGLAVTGSRPGRYSLQVTDRLAGAVAVHGEQRTPLPRDSSSTHVVTLVRGGDDRWRVSGVAAPTTRVRPPGAS